MSGLPEQIIHGRLFGGTPAVHDEYIVSDAGHHAQIVSDHQDAQLPLLLQPGDEFEDLRLDGDVEGCGGLVSDEQVGFAGQRHGDHGSLPHAAGELVRVLPALRAGSGMPTSPSMSTACRWAARRPVPKWRRRASAICSPTV